VDLLQDSRRQPASQLFVWTYFEAGFIFINRLLYIWLSHVGAFLMLAEFINLVEPHFSMNPK